MNPPATTATRLAANMPAELSSVPTSADFGAAAGAAASAIASAIVVELHERSCGERKEQVPCHDFSADENNDLRRIDGVRARLEKWSVRNLARGRSML